MGISNLKIDKSLPKASSPEATELRQSVDKAFPFLGYAIRNVMYHADAAEGGGVNQRGFLHTFQLTDWIKLDNVFEVHEVRRYTQNASLLYILANNNMGNLIRAHPSNLSCFEVEDERYGPPIFAALATNSIEATWAFLEAQMATKPPKSPLHDLCKQYCQDGNKRTNFGRNFTFSRRRGILHHLTERGDDVITLVFIDSDAFDLNLRDSSGQTPLLWAVKGDHEAAVKLLVEKGADVNLADSSGRTPLFWAAEKGHEAVVKLLVEKGAKLNSADSSGQAPLSRTV